jgi:hypothetical protein
LHVLYRVIVGNPPDEIKLDTLKELTGSDREAHLYAKYLSGPVTDVDPHEIAFARPKVQADIVQTNKSPVLIKTHNARIEDGGAPLINTEVSAGAIYVIRNPLDVALSFARFQATSIDQAITNIADEDFGIGTTPDAVYYLTTSWSEHVESWTAEPDPLTHVVRYEDMIEKPIETFSAMANHILMPHSREQLQQAIELASFGRLQQAEKKTGYKDKPKDGGLFFREGRSGQWRETLTPAQVDRIISDHGEQMRRFGYLD